jgi:hypothetical protein
MPEYCSISITIVPVKAGIGIFVMQSHVVAWMVRASLRG